MYGYSKKKFWSTSGWENSHFGGFNRIIWDYPYIKMPYEGKIEVDPKLRRDQGIHTSEKLIKIYLMKCKEYNLVQYLEMKRIVKKNIIGRETAFDVLDLSSEDVLNAVMKQSKEFAPLFDHYRESILKSSIEVEVPEGKGKGEGGDQGEGEDNEEGQGQGEKGEGEGQEGQGEGQGDGDDSDGDGDSDGEDEGDGEAEKRASGGWGSCKSGFEKLKEIIDSMAEQKPFAKFGSLSAENLKPKFIPVKPKHGKDYEPSRDEKLNAELLLKQLDISFDPKSDEIKNLKLGKLDTSKLAEVPAGNISVYKQTVEEQDTREFAVCVLADMSGSMEGPRLDTQFKVLNSIYLALSEIIPMEDLHIYGHTGDEPEPSIYTFCSPHSPDYLQNIKRYYNISCESNYDGAVIETVHKKIRETTDRPVILISLSDGQPCDDVDDMKKILERARRDQFVTVGIGIQTDYVKNIYTYHKAVYDLTEMPKDVAHIVNQVVKLEFQ